MNKRIKEALVFVQGVLKNEFREYGVKENIIKERF